MVLSDEVKETGHCPTSLEPSRLNIRPASPEGARLLRENHLVTMRDVTTRRDDA